MILVASLATFLTGTLLAQDSAQLRTVRIIEVMPGKNAEFVELQQTLMEAQKKAGGSGRSVWQEARGNTSVFHIVGDSDNFAELDSPAESVMSDAEWANWLNRISQVIKSRQVLTLRTVPDAYINSKDGEEPNLLRLNLITLASRGDRVAYTNWITDSLTPALRKQGVTGRSLSRVMFGDNNNTVVSGSRLSSWAELDQPGALNKLSDEKRTEIFSGLSDIEFHETKSLILRYRANLSY
jgi:hypothetical protein